MRPRYVLFALSAAAALVLSGCSSSSADEYADSLKKAGFDHVKVTEDKESKTKKKKKELVAYDFDWTVNTDSDGTTCVVELEHAASRSGSLTGKGWYIDEVNGKDVTDSPTSPNPDAVREYLKSHNLDC